ncbi:DUF2339 domain-containing protein [Aquimarina sediminis]|uniref:DUF2339 domain-containing protein n=1 Tax=Aquimarina sediminis TaxID=2070536 RepID=UPI000CA0805D|nr:DUF2339 domain-containing protein [Aquimarina sediminis]
MGDNQDQIQQLLEKLNILLKRQQDFSTQIQSLKDEIYKLKASSTISSDLKTENPTPLPKAETSLENAKKPISSDSLGESKPEPVKQIKAAIPKPKTPKKKSNLEKFIGENLINKIGIVIIVIGVAIGAKYTIEHDLIGPLTRIILGYLTGLGLLGIGMKLKKKYENFSAVLVSGAMAIMYFITFLAYDLYDLIPQTMTFVLMLLFTAFTVFAAIQYNKQVIAHIGLVGAYAVPFLLSDGSGRVLILFSYMAIINAGILIIAAKKYWKSLYFSSFFLTWIIFISWYVDSYSTDEHFVLGFAFLSLFFATFYSMFLVYKLRKKESFRTTDVILQLANSFVFYGVGVSMLNNHEVGKELLGVFTLINAVIHFVVSVIIYKLKLADRNLFYFISGMVLIFVTITFPVQLDGNWVTLLWASEAALLFWIGRTKKVPIYEILSYPLWGLTFFSLIHDWIVVYYRYNPSIPETGLTPIFNIYLVTSILCIVSYIFIYFIHRKEKLSFPWPKEPLLYTLLTVVIALLLICTSYFTFWVEIDSYWDRVYEDTNQLLQSQNVGTEQYSVTQNIRHHRGAWLINYTSLFLIVLSFVNIKKIKNNIFGYITFGVFVIVLFTFLNGGLYLLSELRENYLELKDTEFNPGTFSYLGMRYISLLLFAGLMFTMYHYVRQKFLDRTFKTAFEIIMHCSLIWVVSSELIHWLDLAGYTETYKLGLSILWGVYSLLLIVLGIWKRKKYLRVLAIILFGITLIKLFFYDISHLGTIAKTVVFLSLGVLLLIISFLYNKYKHIIADEKEN